MHAKQSCMQGLITIRLGDSDIVFETAGDRLIEAMHRTKHPITSIDTIDDDTKRVNIHDLGERFMLAAHLLIDGIKVFLATNGSAWKAFALEAGLQGGLNLQYDFLTVATNTFHSGVDSSCPHWVKSGKTQLLKFHAHIVHTKPISNWGIDVQRLPSDATTFVRGKDL